jgi:cytosine/adenosine deaminase-related metal-dependent hydrolase
LAYDLLIKNGKLVDPKNGVLGVRDVAFSGGKVARVGAAGESLGTDALRVLDAAGKYLFPGVIDLHVHISMRSNGPVAHKMLARAGVTTTLDLGGPVHSTLEAAANHGAGLTVASLHGFVPGDNLPSRDASREDLQKVIATAFKGGAIGVKIHYDNALTPEAAERAIDESNKAGAWVAFHCGTTATASDITGLREAVKLAGKNRLQLAHVNSYCRGNVTDPVVEAQECLALCAGAPHLFAESYLSVNNGTSGRCKDGKPMNGRVAGIWLPAGGYPGTQEGLKQAIFDGWARVQAQVGDDSLFATGAFGVEYWESRGTNVGMSFPVNPPIGRAMLAVAKDKTGRHIIDALGTDGGGIPRNDMVSSGLGLVQLEMMTVSDLVKKIAWTPARVIGLTDKGHLGVGADADAVIVDPVTRNVRTTIAGGRIIMHENVVFGSSSRFVTTKLGADAVRAAGCEPVVIDVTKTGFYTGDGLKA